MLAVASGRVVLIAGASNTCAPAKQTADVDALCTLQLCATNRAALLASETSWLVVWLAQDRLNVNHVWLVCSLSLASNNLVQGQSMSWRKILSGLAEPKLNIGQWQGPRLYLILAVVILKQAIEQ